MGIKDYSALSTSKKALRLMSKVEGNMTEIDESLEEREDFYAEKSRSLRFLGKGKTKAEILG